MIYLADWTDKHKYHQTVEFTYKSTFNNVTFMIEIDFVLFVFESSSKTYIKYILND